jgi:uncharacterized protein (DUF1778 family)
VPFLELAQIGIGVDMGRTKLVSVRLTTDEKNQMEQRAGETGLSLSAFVRRAALGRPLQPHAAAEARCELRDCVLALHRLHRTVEENPEFSVSHERRLLDTVADIQKLIQVLK